MNDMFFEKLQKLDDVETKAIFEIVSELTKGGSAVSAIEKGNCVLVANGRNSIPLSVAEVFP